MRKLACSESVNVHVSGSLLLTPDLYVHVNPQIKCMLEWLQGHFHSLVYICFYLQKSTYFRQVGPGKDTWSNLNGLSTEMRYKADGASKDLLRLGDSSI